MNEMDNCNAIVMLINTSNANSTRKRGSQKNNNTLDFMQRNNDGDHNASSKSKVYASLATSLTQPLNNLNFTTSKTRKKLWTHVSTLCVGYYYPLPLFQPLFTRRLYMSMKKACNNIDECRQHIDRSHDR